MADNPYREASIQIEGKRLPLRYNWDALARIKARWPDEVYDLHSIDVLEEMVSIGLYHVDPSFTPERVRKASPPIHPTIDGVSRALWAAYWGAVKEYPENPQKPGLVTQLKKLFELAPQWASNRANSGT